MPSQVTNESISPRQRLVLRRAQTADTFKADNSIRAMQRKKGQEGAALEVIYLGIAITASKKNAEEYAIGITAHDGTYSIDYKDFTLPKTAAAVDAAAGMSLVQFLINKINSYRQQKHFKILGAGVTEEANTLCPELRSRLWQELDIVCFKFTPFSDISEPKTNETTADDTKVDEESDSVARKAIEKFGPNNMPRLMVKSFNEVAVDSDGAAELATLEDYENTVHPNTWKATMQFVDSLKARNIKIAFFNSTPQGGGVALMRHALIRFLRLAGVDCKWYVPRPKPEVFRITKTNHNILQGVDQKSRLGEDNIRELDDWCEQNARRYWTREKGPLRPTSEGGADVIVIDDPQMPKLVDIAKKLEPERPVIFRSHIQIRADLVNEEGTSASQVWNWLWEHIRKCDVFVSHPVREFVPNSVTPLKVGYMPATTDWLDGLNKAMKDWDLQYYMHEFFLETVKAGVNRDREIKFKLKFPSKHRPYIVQIARFDPAKGIDDVIKAYAHFRSKCIPAEWEEEQIPQLVITGHGAADDPDASIIYDQTMKLIKDEFSNYEEDIIVMRVGPSDQILNTIMTNAKVALQLSTREGFEVKVSEALHHGIPIIATHAGGIPLQVYDGRSGYLVQPGDYKKVAEHLNDLFTDETLYNDMCNHAAHNITDEVSTVGNALCWLYLADTLSKGEPVLPNSGWINDMARLASVPYDDAVAKEVRIQRTAKLDLVKDAYKQRAADERAFMERRASEVQASQLKALAAQESDKQVAPDEPAAKYTTPIETASKEKPSDR